MKRKLFLLLLLCIPAAISFAKQRTQYEAHNIAEVFLKSNTETRSSLSAEKKLTLAYACEDVNMSTRSSNNESITYYYVFNISDNDGFVIVSGDDRAKDVLGYSQSGYFDVNSLPVNFENWLAVYKEEIEELINASGNEYKEIETVSSTAQSLASSVNPLLGDINWNQSAPYNNLCPVIPSGTNAGKRTVTGCVATAMAQIMGYHKWPTKGTGSSHAYSTGTLSISIPSVNFGNTTYDWTNMTGTYNSSSTLEQENAVATLMYHCGVSVQMNYNIESGATTAKVAESLPKYFGYDEGINCISRVFFDAAGWRDIIKNELSNSRPVLFSGQSSGGGHAFVCDGYNSSNLFHFNWGWGGMSNGYFELSALNPGSLGIGAGSGGYNSQQSVIIGIQKPTGSSTPAVTKMGYKSIWTDTESISLGSDFEVKAEHVVLSGAKSLDSGHFGVALCNENDAIISMLYSYGPTDLSLGYYYASPKFVCEIPSGTQAGNYRIRLAYSTKTLNPAAADFKLMDTKVGALGYIKAEVKNSKAYFSSPTENLPVLKLNSFNILSNNLYSGKTGEFEASITNTSNNEYNANLSIIFNIPSVGNALVLKEPVVIAAGETKTVTFKGKISYAPNTTNLLVSGSYTVHLGFETNNSETGVYWSALKTLSGVQILPEPTELYALSLNERIAFPDINKVYTNSAKLTAQIKNTGGLFEGYVVAFIFPKTGGVSLTHIGYQEVSIDKGQTKEVTFSGAIDLPVNIAYNITVYYHNGITWVDLDRSGFKSSLNFTLLEPTVGIEQNYSDKSIGLYPNPATDFVKFDSEDVVKTVRISDVFGKQVFVKSLNENGTISVPVQDLSNGTYILQAETDKGVITDKFIKK
ncbi:T9SS C-terminal target domain-containing protein [Dysgonomonas sp. 216]|uniref:thiol protease/hemagglutinin PrtT n=1 Tax=Dysgonomonas sp. 216 TaxID=2302934 RepID=UPI0013D38E64|nr:thiol protease/hemagglutinin PrtT [Dysgonomonas sp. 216]NDW17713.1 T9SS C-terminal target domain-containing protein [Dysgonomonas sp. 216]